VDIIHPNFTVTKTCTSEPVPAQGPATFEVVVTNTGDVNLSFTTNEAAQSSLAEPFTVGKNGASVTFTITIPAPSGGDVSNSITVTASLIGQPVCTEYTDNQKSARDICHGGGETRTWGFWAQHCDFAKRIFYCAGEPIDLGWVVLDPNSSGLSKLYGVFKSHSDNTACPKDNDLCRARIQASVQALAAILSSYLSNGAPLPVEESEIAATLGGCDINEIKDLGSLLATFNESGDSNLMLYDCDSKPQGKASGACAKRLGNCNILRTACTTCDD